MMKLKRFAVLVIVLAMIASLGVGCSKQNENQQNEEKNKVNTSGAKDNEENKKVESDDSIYNPIGELPIAKETVKLSMYLSIPANIILEGNELLPYIKDLTNIDVELIPGAAERAKSQEKVSLMLAAQTDLPDIIVDGISNEQLTEYGGQGLFINVKDYWDMCPNYQKIEEIDPQAVKSITMADGNLYGFIRKNWCYHCLHAQRMWINQTWLDNLDLETPTTTEEYYNVLKAFKAEDANGNGDPNDEIPLIASTDKWNCELFGYLIQPFNPNTDRTKNVFHYNDNGTIKCAAIEDGFKEGVKYLRTLYSEKLLDEESFSIKHTQIRTLTSDPNGNRIGSIPAGFGWFMDTSDPEGARNDFVPLNPIAGPDGTRRTVTFNTSAESRWAISSECENIEAAVRLGDLFLTLPFYNDSEEDLKLANSFVEGPTGYNLYNDPDKIAISGEQARYDRAFSYGDPTNKNLGNNLPRYSTVDRKHYMLYEPGSYNLEKIAWDSSTEYSEFGLEIEIPSIVVEPELAAETAEIGSLLQSYITEQLASFVLGTRDIDVEWDDYVQEVKDMGQERYTQIIQDSYDARYK